MPVLQALTGFNFTFFFFFLTCCESKKYFLQVSCPQTHSMPLFLAVTTDSFPGWMWGALGTVRKVGIVMNWQGGVAFSFTLLFEWGSEFNPAAPLFPGMLVLVSIPTLKLPS